MNVRVTTLVGAALGAMLWAAPTMARIPGVAGSS